MIKVGDSVWQIAAFWKPMERQDRSIGVPFVYVYRYPNWIVLPYKKKISKKDKKYFYFSCEIDYIKKTQCFKRKCDAIRAAKMMTKIDRRRFVKDIVKKLQQKMI